MLLLVVVMMMMMTMMMLGATAQEYGGECAARNVADIQIHETRTKSQPQQNTNSPTEIPPGYTQVYCPSFINK